MTTPTPHPYLAAEAARAAERKARRAQPCACGADYVPNAHGVREHQIKHGHRPCPPRNGGDAA